MQCCDLEVPIKDAGGRAIRIYRRARLYSLVEQQSKPEYLDRISVFEGNPSNVLELKGAVLPAGGTCLYSRDGYRIDLSCTRRGRDGTFPFQEASRIDIPRDVISIAEPVIYLGLLQNHWGHFLTEGISRLWMFDEEGCSRRLGFYSCRTAIHPNIRAALSDTPHRIHVGAGKLSKGIRFENVLVPAPSFINQLQAFTGHGSVFRNRKTIASQKRVAEAVVLSRSCLNSVREIRETVKLDSVLEQCGAAIVYPEKLTFDEQRELVDADQTFVGCWGSAFHTLLLSRRPETLQTHVICEDTPNANLLMMDAALNIESNYLAALTADPFFKWPALKLELDFECIKRYLEWKCLRSQHTAKEEG